METKNKNPISYLNGKNPHNIIELYFELNHLKQIYRKGWLIQGGISKSKCESVADHSFGTAMLGFFLAKEDYPKLDAVKVLKLGLIHDVGETYVGDITPHDKVSPEEKRKLERSAIKKVFSKLRNGKEYMKLWEEFEAGNTEEAKFVRQIDKLEMILQAAVYEHHHAKNLESFFESGGVKIKDPKLKKLVEEIRSIRRSGRK